jgi:hypothetical protein
MDIFSRHDDLNEILLRCSLGLALALPCLAFPCLAMFAGAIVSLFSS